MENHRKFSFTRKADGVESKIFSEADKKIANDETVEVGHTVYSYLGTPKGKFLKFIPASIKDSLRGKVVKLKP